MPLKGSEGPNTGKAIEARFGTISNASTLKTNLRSTYVDLMWHINNPPIHPELCLPPLMVESKPFCCESHRSSDFHGGECRGTLPREKEKGKAENPEFP